MFVSLRRAAAKVELRSFSSSDLGRRAALLGQEGLQLCEEHVQIPLDPLVEVLTMGPAGEGKVVVPTLFSQSFSMVNPMVPFPRRKRSIWRAQSSPQSSLSFQAGEGRAERRKTKPKSAPGRPSGESAGLAEVRCQPPSPSLIPPPEDLSRRRRFFESVQNRPIRKDPV